MSPGATQSDPAGPETGTTAPRWERAAVAGLLVYFAARMVFLACVLAPGVPPDEVTPLGRIGLYSAVPLVPIDSADSAELGLVGHRPYLYYFSMGRLLQLGPAGIDELRFLRLANCILGLFTALVAYRWIRLVSSSPLVRLAFLVFVTNTLMWSGLFASVSYDNLANLLAALACYQLTRFCTERDPGSLAAFGLWIGLGILTKKTILPLAAILLLVLLVRERRGLLPYLGAWTHLMFERIYGYFGHERIIPSRAELAPFYLFYFLAAVIVASYTAVLIFFVHRPLYEDTGSLSLSVQGRYLFPVLLPLYGLVATGLLALFAPRVRPLVALASAGYFVYADLPYLLSHAPAAWWQAGLD